MALGTISLFARLVDLVSKRRSMLSVSVSLRSGTYFVVTIPVAERELQLKAPSAQELGRVVATELASAAKRDGA
jgi:hypothetical protein